MTTTVIDAPFEENLHEHHWMDSREELRSSRRGRIGIVSIITVPSVFGGGGGGGGDILPLLLFHFDPNPTGHRKRIHGVETPF